MTHEICKQLERIADALEGPPAEELARRLAEAAGALERERNTTEQLRARVEKAERLLREEKIRCQKLRNETRK